MHACSYTVSALQLYEPYIQLWLPCQLRSHIANNGAGGAGSGQMQNTAEPGLP